MPGFCVTIIAFAVILIGAHAATAAIVVAPSCSQQHVQAAIDIASNGDIVDIPAGTCTWTEVNGAPAVHWENKAIHLRGAGIGQTTITTGRAIWVNATTATGADFRISGFTFTHPTAYANAVISIANMANSNPTKGWRLDHNRFLFGNGGQVVFVWGLTWGVVDHNTFDTSTTTPPAAVYLYGYLASEDGSAANLLGSTYWNRPMNLGSDEAVYFEDNTVNYGTMAPDQVQALNDMAFGGSLVVRHNIIDKAFVQTHSARDNKRGGMKYEIYENTFINMNNRFALIRSGSGVFFNNHVVGSWTSIDIDSQHIPGACTFSAAPISACNGSNSLDGNVESTGWPCLDQPGRGGKQASVPLYAWNNGSNAACTTGTACNLTTSIQLNCSDQSAYLKSTPHTNGVVDFVNNGATPKPGYTPFVYPHPIVSGAGNPPSAPTNLRIVP